MKIENKQPDYSCDLSLHPIDCGFDPRTHGMDCSLPKSATRVGYEHNGAKIVSGSAEEIAAELRKAGYQVTLV